MLKAVCQNTLPFHSRRNITARFDGGSLTSDAGWLLFGSLDRQHRLCEGFSCCISESRDQRYIRHDLLKLIRQRVLQIVAGYEDCNDADTLRSDPMLKTVCDQLPESDPDLATQPTFSRLENSVTKKDLMRLSRWLLGRYVRSLKKRRPAKIILDLDSTDDHTHGQQEFSFYHGYYRNHILHPLLIFDADTGDLVCAVLRPGNKGAASHLVPILKRVVEAIRQGVGRDVEIEIRADSGFATPRLYEFCECEENKLQYVIGLSRNPRKYSVNPSLRGHHQILLDTVISVVYISGHGSRPRPSGASRGESGVRSAAVDSRDSDPGGQGGVHRLALGGEVLEGPACCGGGERKAVEVRELESGGSHS